MPIARWKPNARERLQAAALDLFAERGYDQATAAEIAARADLTERTFFRHFADKREVLFDGQEALQDLLVDDAAPGEPRAVIAAGLEAMAVHSTPAATSSAAARRSSSPTPNCESAS